MSEELKPCPFCGYEAVLCDYGNCASVYCKGCHASMHDGNPFGNPEYRQAATAAWNRRVTPENKQEGDYVR